MLNSRSAKKRIFRFRCDAEPMSGGCGGCLSPMLEATPLTTYSASVSVNADRCEYSLNE